MRVRADEGVYRREPLCRCGRRLDCPPLSTVRPEWTLLHRRCQRRQKAPLRSYSLAQEKQTQKRHRTRHHSHPHHRAQSLHLQKASQPFRTSCEAALKFTKRNPKVVGDRCNCRRRGCKKGTGIESATISPTSEESRLLRVAGYAMRRERVQRQRSRCRIRTARLANCSNPALA